MIRFIKDEWIGNGRGNFSEIYISVAEIMIGMHILIIGETYTSSSILMDKLDKVLPFYVTGILWLCSGLLTFSGIELYNLDKAHKFERLLRSIGALGSIFIWSFAGVTLIPSPFCYIYFLTAVASMRALYLTRVR